jgi:hypothetical protein
VRPSLRRQRPFPPSASIFFQDERKKNSPTRFEQTRFGQLHSNKPREGFSLPRACLFKCCLGFVGFVRILFCLFCSTAVFFEEKNTVFHSMSPFVADSAFINTLSLPERLSLRLCSTRNQGDQVSW